MAQSLIKFGYNMHEWQIDACKSILKGCDTVVVAGTGFGKSLVFQAPVLDGKHTALVMSPTLSLIDDQVQILRARGVKVSVHARFIDGANVYFLRCRVWV
ncbi:P-loop containing nucleoside triphosphate hydrolase protein [Peziza echinospora]|nr:P-loop containing nucleoside triphosphate hydrolase protein [Peziza echinospora]